MRGVVEEEEEEQKEEEEKEGMYGCVVGFGIGVVRVD